MNKKEFTQYIQELQRYYGEKLNETEAEIWYKNLSFMTIERFNLIMSEIYKTNKFMPKLSEILDMHKQIPYTATVPEKEIKGHCEKCNDTGYVIFTEVKDGYPYEYAAVCECGRANRYSGKECTDPRNKSDYYIPTTNELGLEVETTRPSDERIIESMNKLKNSSIVSEDIKNIIRQNFKKRMQK